MHKNTIKLNSSTNHKGNIVCHLSSVHPRFDGRIYEKECQSLAAAGYKVYLIVADGLGDNINNQINILDVGKALHGRLLRILIKPWQVFWHARKLNADLYHFHDPELIPIGLVLKLFGKKVIYDIHEDLPTQIMHKPWIPKPFRKLISSSFSLIEGLSCKAFDALFVPQPTMKKSYQKHNANTELIANFVDIDGLSIDETTPIKTREQCNLIHAGALGKERGLFNMVNTMEYLEPNYCLFLAGNFQSSQIKEKFERHPFADRTEYLGRLSKEEMDEIYLNSSIGLILYNNVGQYYLSYAIKLFEFMARGIPVIMPNFGEWPDFNEKYQCGICVDVTSPKDVACAISSLQENKELSEACSKNGKAAIKKEFNWANESTKMINIYQGIIHAI